MTSARPVIIAGAGIGGLTTALALARCGFRVVVLEQAERLEETGAGIQLSPNAARILIELGLEEKLRASAVAPTALRVLAAANGREIVRMPLGETAAARYERALLGDPSRRFTGRARRGGGAAAQRHAQARHARRGLRRPSQRHHRIHALRCAYDRRTRLGADRCRRTMVGGAPTARPPRTAALCRPHRLAGSRPGTRGRRRNSARHSFICGSAATLTLSIIRSNRARPSTLSSSPKIAGTRPAGASRQAVPTSFHGWRRKAGHRRRVRSSGCLMRG